MLVAGVVVVVGSLLWDMQTETQSEI